MGKLDSLDRELRPRTRRSRRSPGRRLPPGFRSRAPSKSTGRRRSTVRSWLTPCGSSWPLSAGSGNRLPMKESRPRSAPRFAWSTPTTRCMSVSCSTIATRRPSSSPIAGEIRRSTRPTTSRSSSTPFWIARTASCSAPVHRAWSSTAIGGFFGGDRVQLRPTQTLRAGEAFNAQLSWDRNDINLPGGSFVANLGHVRVNYSFTPRMFVQALVQYNDGADLWSSNLRFG